MYAKAPSPLDCHTKAVESDIRQNKAHIDQSEPVVMGYINIYQWPAETFYGSAGGLHTYYGVREII